MTGVAVIGKAALHRHLDYQSRRANYVIRVPDKLVNWGFAPDNLGGSR